MFLDHPQVIWGREGRHSLRDQVVAGKTGTNLDEVTRLPDQRHALSQDELDVTVLGPDRDGSCGVQRPAAVADRRAAALLRTLCRSGLTLTGRGLGFLGVLVLVSVVLAMRIPILVIKPHAMGGVDCQAGLERRPSSNVRLEPELHVSVEGEPYVGKPGTACRRKADPDFG